MSSIRKRIIGVVIAVLMLIVCPIAVFATEGGQADAVAKNTTTAVTYDDVSEAVIEAAEGETIVLLNDTEAKVVSVTENVTVDLNGYVLKASYFTCFGNIVDKSDDNTGILKVEASRFLIQDSNAQLPVKGSEGYQFVDVTGFNKIFQDGKYMFQPFIEKSGHALIKDGNDASGVTINVRVSWEAENGKRSQIFEYKDEMVSQFLESYYNNEDVEKYSKAFNLSLNGAEGISELTFNAVVISNTGVEFISEPVVVKNDNTGNSGDGEQGEGPLDPGTPDDPNEPGDDDIEGKPENPGDNTGGEGNEGDNTDDPTVEFPEDEDGKISGNISVDESNFVTEDVELKKLGQSISAIVPAGVKVEEGTTKLVLTIKAKNNSDSDVETEEDEVLKPFDVHIEGIAADNTKPIIINMGEIMPVGMNIGNYTFYHVEGDVTKEMTAVSSVEELNAHNQFYYDPATGNVTVCMTTFSEVVVVADEVAAWEGKFDYNWYDESKTELTIANADQLAAFGAIVGGMNGQTQDSFAGKTVKLVSDVNLGDKESENNPNLIFYPIGYYNNTEEGTYKKTSGGSVTSSVSSFEGTVDGNGHTVANFYQNTWEMFGDYNDGYSGTPNHYKDAMGLFGYVHGGIVKNLTVSNFSSDGEFTPTGIIAAYADGEAIFENIAITKCNPRVYNTGNGGIIGIAGDTGTKNDDHITLKNITVDNSNKISALWGSWDVACGGLVGMYRGNVDGSGNATGDTISFNNCHVSAIIDVYNDVCANYQYYAYRYSGMIIGSVRHNTKNDDGKTIPNMAGISAEDCTVNYGDWNDYYYCEFEKNTMASYSEDYQFSRVPHSELNFTDSNGNGVVDADERASVTGCKHTHTAEENHQAIYLPFHQLFTGYSWGVSSIGLEKYSGIVTDQGITEGDQEESVEKFVGIADTSYMTDTTVKISDLFKALENPPVAINTEAIMVSVTPIGEGSTANGVYTPNESDWTKGTLNFSGAGNAKITITDYHFCKPTVINVTIDATQKINTKFTGDFLYRVGNQNKVELSSIFEVVVVTDKDGNAVDATINSSTVDIKIESKEGDAGGECTENESDWTKGSIQFSGTGVVTVTVSAEGSIPCVLNLEVVNAKNITKAESATEKDVVLLNDISGTFTVSNGHTFYGNGFTVTLPTTHVQNVGNGFTGYISIGASQDDGIANGGHLDNVRIEGPVYPEMYIYRDQAKITNSSDSDYGDGYNMRYFKNSVIVYGGNCTISNSYISGSRTALCLRGGNNVVIENTTLSGGAYANMQICAGSNVTLRNLTTVQTDVPDSYGKGKTAHGLGIAVDSNVVDLYIEGELNQYNWLNQDKWNNIVPSTYQSTFPKFFTNDGFSKYWHYLNGGSDPYVNLAFIYACDWDTSKIHDNRTTVDYGTTGATIAGVSGGVYSKVNTVGGNAITDADLRAPEYKSPGFNPVAPVFNFDNTANHDADDANDANDTYCVYNESTGTLKVGVSGDSKTLDLSSVAVTKNGTTLTHTAYLNGTKIDGDSVTIKAADGAKQTLTFKATSNDAGYDKDGKPIAGSIEYTWNVNVEIAVLSYPAPEWNMGGDYQFDKNNFVYAYYGTSNGYGEAVQIYEGIKINYYNKNGKLVNLDLSGTTTHPTGSNNSNSNAFTYTLNDGSTLTMKFSSGWKSGATTHQFTTYEGEVYIYPQSLDNDNYIRAKVANQDFDVKINYTFTDPNGQSISQTMQWYNAKDTNSKVTTVQWKDFDSTNGKKPSVCVTPDTLVALADGSQKEIQDVTYDDQLVVWDFYKGEYTLAPSVIVKNHGESNYEVVIMNFDDGTSVKTINGHGFYDKSNEEFVILTKDNVEEYIGHEFVKQNGDSNVTVKLESFDVTTEFTESWSILTANHYNCILEGMLTLTPAEVEGSQRYLMPYEIKDMKYVEDFMKADIDKYGLYAYNDFEDYMTYEQYKAFGLDNFKVSVGKGYITWDEIMYLIDLHVK